MHANLPWQGLHSTKRFLRWVCHEDTYEAVLIYVQQGVLLAGNVRNLHTERLSDLRGSETPAGGRQEVDRAYVTIVRRRCQVLILLASKDVNGNEMALCVPMLASL